MLLTSDAWDERGPAPTAEWCRPWFASCVDNNEGFVHGRLIFPRSPSAPVHTMNVLNFKSLCVHTFKFVMGSYGPLTALERAHEISVSEDGRSEVKYPFAFKNLDWDEYHRFRPQYPDSMFKTWLDYHREHSGRFQTAHDIGAGENNSLLDMALRTDKSSQVPARWRLGSRAVLTVWW